MIDLNKLTKTGNKQIDDEHIQFLTNINNLYAIIKKESDKESISAKLSEMILYAREHFLHEEDIINSIDYPNAKQHKREHEKVLNNMQLAIMQCREKNNTDFLNNTLKINIEEWVLHHIKTMDIPLLELYYKQKNKEA